MRGLTELPPAWGRGNELLVLVTVGTGASSVLLLVRNSRCASWSPKLRGMIT